MRDGDRRAGTGPVAFHAFVAIEQRHTPIGPQFLRGEQHIVVSLPDARVVLALVIPSGRFLRRLVQRGAQHHVLDGERGHHGVVRLQHARADDVGIGIQQARRQAYRLKVQVVIDQRDDLVFGFRIQIHQRDVARGAVGGEFDVPEIPEALHGFAGGRFHDAHRQLVLGLQVVQNSPDGVGMGGRQLIRRGDVVHLDDHVFLALDHRPDLVVDGIQRVVNHLAAHVSFDDGDGGFRGWFLVKVSGGVFGPATCARSAVKPPTPATAWKKLLRETFMAYLQTQKQTIRPYYNRTQPAGAEQLCAPIRAAGVILLCHKRQIRPIMFSWLRKTRRQHHKRNASRHI